MCQDQALCDLISAQTLEIQGLRSDLSAFPFSLRQEFSADYELVFDELLASSHLFQFAFWVVPPVLFFVFVYRYLREFLI